MNNIHFDEVFSYLNGEMSSEQAAAFEQRLASEPLLQEELNMQKRTMDNDSGRFEAILNQAHRTLQSPDRLFQRLRVQSDQIVLQTLRDLENDIQATDVPAVSATLEQAASPPAEKKLKRLVINRTLFNALRIAAVVTPLVVAVTAGWYYWGMKEAAPVAHESPASPRENGMESLPENALIALVNTAIDNLPGAKEKLPTTGENLHGKSPEYHDTKTATNGGLLTPSDRSPKDVNTNSKAEIPTNGELLTETEHCSLEAGITRLRKGQFVSAQQIFEELLNKKCLNEANAAYAKYSLALSLLAQQDTAQHALVIRLLNEAKPDLPDKEQMTLSALIAKLPAKKSPGRIARPE